MRTSYISAPYGVTSTANFLYAAQKLSDFSARKKHVLLVEDNLFLQHIHSTWLEELHYEVTVVGSGEAALQKFLSDYDAVLMDLDLPGDNGVITTQKLLRKNPTVKIPIIACTTHPESKMKDACISAGMVGYLQKPVSPARLAQFLTIHLA